MKDTAHLTDDAFHTHLDALHTQPERYVPGQRLDMGDFSILVTHTPEAGFTLSDIRKASPLAPEKDRKLDDGYSADLSRQAAHAASYAAKKALRDDTDITISDRDFPMSGLDAASAQAVLESIYDMHINRFARTQTAPAQARGA